MYRILSRRLAQRMHQNHIPASLLTSISEIRLNNNKKKKKKRRNLKEKEDTFPSEKRKKKGKKRKKEIQTIPEKILRLYISGERKRDFSAY